MNNKPKSTGSKMPLYTHENNEEGSHSRRMTDEEWQAIVENEASYDGTFYYAVKTTGIFCRPSCKSRAPKKENVLLFRNANEALSEGVRPCKRCKPNGLRLPDEDWTRQIIHVIDMNYHEPFTLMRLADMCHGSPYHLHCTFKKMTGYTPKQYQKLQNQKDHREA